ncbi:MAG: YkgJ family cysteine cluster protein [Planctomycetes bacterium]|nr:YkgJ family cysteine cluster protein [Planctomycetota bacterium]
MSRPADPRLWVLGAGGAPPDLRPAFSAGVWEPRRAAGLLWRRLWRGERFIRRGECRKTGDCCREITLFLYHRPVSRMEQFHAAVSRAPALAGFFPIGQGPDGSLRFGCRHLTAENRCGIYESRPPLCREYPNPGAWEDRAVLQKNCGYDMVPAPSVLRLLQHLLRLPGWRPLPGPLPFRDVMARAAGGHPAVAPITPLTYR